MTDRPSYCTYSPTSRFPTAPTAYSISVHFIFIFINQDETRATVSRRARVALVCFFLATRKRAVHERVSQRLPWRVFANALAGVFGCGCVVSGHWIRDGDGDDDDDDGTGGGFSRW